MTIAGPIDANFELESGDIHVWCSRDDPLTAAAPVNCGEWLSTAERKQERAFYFAHDRRQYLISRTLLRATLSRYAPGHPSEWRFACNPYGRPEVLNAAAVELGLSFNLSHTRGLIVLAVTRHRTLGVDVENIAYRKPSMALADRYFAANEVAALRAMPPLLQPYRFFEYWTMKEAYIKARGMGLSLPLDQFSFDFSASGRVSLTVRPALNDDAAHWQFWQFQPSSEHLIALCADVCDGSRPPSLVCESGRPFANPTFLRQSEGHSR